MSLVSISLIANIVLVVVTTYYAILTHVLVRANQRQIEFSENQLELQQRPYVEISAGPREGTNLFSLRIINTGSNTARNLKLILAPEFYRFHEMVEKNHMQGLYPFCHTIPSFPPKSQLAFDLGVSYKFFEGGKIDEITPPKFTVTATYDWGARRYEEQTFLDLHMFGGASAASVGSLQELKDLNRNFEKLTDVVRGVVNRPK